MPLPRLDHLTTGVLLCSTNSETRAIYQQLFQNRAITKRCIAHVAARFHSVHNGQGSH
ncbi:pseudouridine synthase [Corynebacterium rouxii]|uniref:pseudouridine synthase n=1 Tax=Corynebacterium rouxii TaxID=2719119 RepID=UPI001E55FEEC|nr:pseudouridine synthase [Corynebacterium rouxii]